DGAGGRDYGDLPVAETRDLAQFVRILPALLRALEQIARNIAVVDATDRIAVHLDYFEKRGFVLRVARERPGGFGDARAGQVGLPAHDGADGTREVAAAVAVIRDAERHQERAQVREAKTQRPVIVGVLRDHFRGIRRVVDQNFLGHDQRIDAMPERFHVELAVWPYELHQVQRRQIA